MLRPTCVLLAIACPLFAQKTDRVPLRGRVLALDGRPWSRARVFLRSPATPETCTPELVDRVETTTDERGRFRARVLSDRPYFVWAAADLRERRDPAMYRVSHVVGPVDARTITTLREDAERRVRLPIRFRGLAAHAAGKRVRCFLMGQLAGESQGAAVGVVEALTKTGEETFDQGYWPGRGATFVLVRDAPDAPVSMTRSFDLSPGHLDNLRTLHPKKSLADIARETATLHLDATPSSRSLLEVPFSTAFGTVRERNAAAPKGTCRVLDAGKPVRDGVVLMRRPGSRRAISVRTDRDGRFRLLAAEGAIEVWLVQPRCATRLLGPGLPPRKIANATIELSELSMQSIRIRNADGSPAGNAILAMHGDARFGALRVFAGRDGRFALRRNGDAPLRVAASWRDGYAESEVPKSGDFDLQGSDAARLRGVVVDPDGQPVPGATVRFRVARAAASAPFAYLLSSRTWTDSEGKFELFVPNRTWSYRISAIDWLGGSRAAHATIDGREPARIEIRFSK